MTLSQLTAACKQYVTEELQTARDVVAGARLRQDVEHALSTAMHELQAGGDIDDRDDYWAIVPKER